MKLKAKKGVVRLLAVLFVCMCTLVGTTTVSAADDTWQTTANEIVTNGGGVSSSDDLAQRLSRVAGGSTFNDLGAEYYTVVVQSEGEKYYVNGAVRNFSGSASLTAKPETSTYTPHSVEVKTTSGGKAISKVWVYINADGAALGKIQANISAGLLSQSGVTPDTGTAMNLMQGAMPIVNTLLGCIVIVISVGMTVFSALDIIYLAFPAFRTKVDESVEGNGKGTKQNKDGSVSSRWVTDDARLAMTEANTNQTQPWGGYFKRRLLAYVFLAIILFILLTGNIFAITTLVTNLLQGLFSSLGIG